LPAKGERERIKCIGLQNGLMPRPKVSERGFRGDAEQGKILLWLFMIAHNERPPASMQELLLWVDSEADQVRVNWRDGFDWRKFQEKIVRKYAPLDAESPSKELVGA
jgi:hypothetical protein